MDGLNDLEEHGLIHKINEKKYNFEYDLEPIYFDPTKTNKENNLWFTVVHTDELTTIMQIEDKKFNVSKAKLIRYFANVVSTFRHGKDWTFLLSDGDKTDGVIGFSSIEVLSDLSNISKDTVLTYNNILEENKVLYIYRANDLLFIDNEVSGITNTYGRYKYKKYIIGEGEDHKNEYGHCKMVESIKHKTAKTAKRKSLGAKYFNLVSGNKMYDEETIIEIYRYAVDFNKRHENDGYCENDLKDIYFFDKFPFITEDCLKDKDKEKRPFPIEGKFDDDIWGESDLLDNDFDIEEIIDMPGMNKIEQDTGQNSLFNNEQ